MCKVFLNTSDHDLIRDFFAPCLVQAARYNRGVGYFSAGWLRLAGQGMVAFAAAGGRARCAIIQQVLKRRLLEAIVARQQGE